MRRIAEAVIIAMGAPDTSVIKAFAIEIMFKDGEYAFAEVAPEVIEGEMPTWQTIQ